LAGLAWVKKIADPPEHLLKFVALNTALQYIAISLMVPAMRKDMWLCIERNHDGELTGWHDTEDTYDLNWRNWGDLFHGLVPSLF
jgi:hypothetical protein